jgi:hypothetical protein
MVVGAIRLKMFSALALGIGVSLPSRAIAADPVRVATFNLALYGSRADDVWRRLESGNDSQAMHLAEIIQRVRPDVLVLNEIDFDPEGRVLDSFCERYLAVGQNSSESAAAAAPIAYPHRLAIESNTGEHSGLDLDRNGRVNSSPGAADYAGDCWGYGAYPGQYAFAVVSRFPIDASAMRQFRRFRWQDIPEARLPDDDATAAPNDWYPPEVRGQLRLSSKNHCDVPIDVGGRTIHLLLSHPTPPVFDGPEDRNGRRNHDELRLWTDYIGPADAARYIIDDAGRRGGLRDSAADQGSGFRVQDGGEGAEASNLQPPAARLPPSFIILGDLNGDPHDGQGPEGIRLLLASPRLLFYPAPTSLGAVESARVQGGANAGHRGDPATDTCDAADDPAPGNLRIDYVLPSADIKVVASGVFWPEADDPLGALVAGAAEPASSDHRLVWVDIAL